MVVNLDKSKQILDCWPHNGIPAGSEWSAEVWPDLPELQTGELLTMCPALGLVALVLSL